MFINARISVLIILLPAQKKKKDREKSKRDKIQRDLDSRIIQCVYVCTKQLSVSYCMVHTRHFSRFAFITWLIVKYRLFTDAHTKRWECIQSCILFVEPDETQYP